LHYINSTGGDITDELDCLIKTAPIYSELTNRRVAISICDLEKCLFYIPAIDLDHKLNSGDSHIQNTCAYECIKIGAKIERKVDFDNGRLTYYAVAIPIRDDDDEIIGAISFSQNYKHNEMLNALVDNIFDTFENFKDLSNQVLNNANDLERLNQKYLKIIEGHNKKLELLESHLRLLNIYDQKLDNYKNQINIDDLKIDLNFDIEEIKKLSDDFKSILSHQVDSNRYIANTTEIISKRVVKLKEQVKIII